MDDKSFHDSLLEARREGNQARQQKQDNEAAKLHQWEAERIAKIQKRIVDAVRQAASYGERPSVKFDNYPEACFVGGAESRDATSRLRGDALLAFELLTSEGLNPRATIESFPSPGGPYLSAVLLFDQPSE